MGKILKFAIWGVGAVAGLVAFFLAGVWIVSGQRLNQKFVAPEDALAHRTDPETLTAGEHLATITGCNGCHGATMQGQVVAEMPDGTRFVAPNIPKIASTYSDADLTRVIRYGVKQNGKPVLMMPSETFFHLNDEDMIAILSYVRAASDSGGDAEKTSIGPLIRFLLAKGEFKTAPENIPDMHVRPEHDLTSSIGRGRYLATVTCAECHGLDFKGQSFGPEFAPPDLVVASAYTPEEFAVLMKTGVASGGRKLGLMELVSQERFVDFTDAEISDLHTFLRDRAMNSQQDN